MNDFLYDIKRTLFGKFTIIMIVLVVLLSFGLAYSVVSSSPASSAPPSAVATVIPYIYPTHGGFMVVDYAVNGYGKPVSGLSINSSVSNYSYSGKLEVPHQLNGITDSKGFVSFYYKTTDESVNSSYYPRYVYGKVEKGELPGIAYFFGGVGAVGFIPGEPGFGNSNSTMSLRSSNYVFIVPVKTPNSDLPNSFLIYFAGPNSTHPPNMKVYYNVSSNSLYTYSSARSPNNMTYYKTISGTNNTVVTLPINSTALNNYTNIMIVSTNGSRMSYNSVFYSVTTPSSMVNSIIQTPFEFLIPILGIFSAYFYYGKDKVSGVLDSIIVRPVTKGRIFFSRFLASAFSFFVALILSLALIDFLVYRFTYTALSSTSFFGIFLGYFAVALAYAGIIYLVSQFTRSQGAILGLGIGMLFLFIPLIWETIVGFIVSLLNINLAVAGSYNWILSLSSISPSFIPTLVTYFRTGLYSSYVTIYSLILIGIVWACVPGVISFFMARNRD